MSNSKFFCIQSFRIEISFRKCWVHYAICSRAILFPVVPELHNAACQMPQNANFTNKRIATAFLTIPPSAKIESYCVNLPQNLGDISKCCASGKRVSSSVQGAIMQLRAVCLSFYVIIRIGVRCNLAVY